MFTRLFIRLLLFGLPLDCNTIAYLIIIWTAVRLQHSSNIFLPIYELKELFHNNLHDRCKFDNVSTWWSHSQYLGCSLLSLQPLQLQPWIVFGQKRKKIWKKFQFEEAFVFPPLPEIWPFLQWAPPSWQAAHIAPFHKNLDFHFLPIIWKRLQVTHQAPQLVFKSLLTFSRYLGSLIQGHSVSRSPRGIWILRYSKENTWIPRRIPGYQGEYLDS